MSKVDQRVSSISGEERDRQIDPICMIVRRGARSSSEGPLESTNLYLAHENTDWMFMMARDLQTQLWPLKLAQGIHGERTIKRTQIPSLWWPSDTLHPPPPSPRFIRLLNLFRPFTFSKWKQDKKWNTYIHGKKMFWKMLSVEGEDIKSKQRLCWIRWNVNVSKVNTAAEKFRLDKVNRLSWTGSVR